MTDTPTDVVAAHIEDVLTRHARDPDPIALTLHMDEPCEVCDEDGHLVNVCTGCYPMWEDMPGHVIWPCVEAKAALDLRAVLATPTDHHNPEEKR